MKTITLIATILLLPTSARAQPESIGSISKAQGGVKRSDVIDVQAGVEPGAAVYRGTRITTESDGSVEIRLAGGSIMRVRPASSIQLSPVKRSRKRKSSVVLFFGRVWSRVTKAVGGETNYEVNTPNAVAGVRGTEFETAVGADGSVRVRVDEGRVAVADDERERSVKRGQRVDGNENGLKGTRRAGRKPGWQTWQNQREDRARSDAGDVVRAMKQKIERRQSRLAKLRAQQTELMNERKRWERDQRLGDPEADAKIAAIDNKLADIADAIADLSDVARSQFGYVDHLAELAADPRFGMINAATIQAEAKTLLKLKRQFDAFEKEGKDMSQEAMDDIMDDARDGKRGTLKDEPGSVKDLFGDD
ncbi:MAG: FecR family protein [Myxococcota bacterium]